MFVLVLFDDILLYNKMWKDHLIHLQIVLEILISNKLFTKQTKCRFGVTQVDYLGHIINHQGMSVDSTKILGQFQLHRKVFEDF